MAKIRMIQTQPGSMDGLNSKLYEEGEEYEIDGLEINQRLVGMFLRAGFCKSVRERAVVLEPSEKTVIEVVPNTKPELQASDPVRVAIEAEKGHPLEPKVEKKSEEMKMRVYELADELNIPWKDVVDIANKLNIKVKAAQAGLTEDEVKTIKGNLK